MKNKSFFIFIFIFSIIILSSLSSAWIVPSSHDFIAKSALLKSSSSTYGQIVSEHFDDFSACQSMTDYSVFYYFSSGFSTIGKQYLASHNNNICSRALEIANKNDKAEISCALGICAMDSSDVSSHNGFVPMMIQRTGLVNGIVHAPSEECVDKKISTPELQSEGRSALVNKYPVHREYLLKVFQSDSRTSTINVGVLMDEFVKQVAGSNTYDVGFQGFTAVPTSIHLILILIFLTSTIMLAYLIRIKDKNLFNKISIGLLLIPIILVIIIYVLYFTGNIWKAFEVASTPYCWVAPINGYETYINQAIQNDVNLFNNGASTLFTLQDPAGLQSLHNADQSNVWKLWVIGIILALLSALFIWLNIRKRKK